MGGHWTCILLYCRYWTLNIYYYYCYYIYFCCFFSTWGPFCCVFLPMGGLFHHVRSFFMKCGPFYYFFPQCGGPFCLYGGPFLGLPPPPLWKFAYVCNALYLLHKWINIATKVDSTYLGYWPTAHSVYVLWRKVGENSWHLDHRVRRSPSTPRYISTNNNLYSCA